MIIVDTQEVTSQLPTLLLAVEKQGETILICRDGKPVAELRGVEAESTAPDPLQVHPELAAIILYDPMEPASEDEWPSEFR